MTRFIDDLENSPAAPTLTPEEIERHLAEARRMRSAMIGNAFAGIGHALARAVAPRRARGTRTTPRHA